MSGYLVISKPVGTIKGERMYFHTFINEPEVWFDTLYFPPAAKIYKVSGKGFYAMTAKAIEEVGAYALNVKPSKKLAFKRKQNAQPTSNII